MANLQKKNVVHCVGFWLHICRMYDSPDCLNNLFASHQYYVGTGDRVVSGLLPSLLALCIPPACPVLWGHGHDPVGIHHLGYTSPGKSCGSWGNLSHQSWKPPAVAQPTFFLGFHHSWFPLFCCYTELLWEGLRSTPHLQPFTLPTAAGDGRLEQRHNKAGTLQRVSMPCCLWLTQDVW